MSATTVTRDYSLVGPEAEKAVAAGLASARWYAPPIPRAELKALMRREDGPAIRDTLIWFAAFIVSGGLGYYFWGSWAAVPFFLVYGVLYGSSTDSRWHECGHRTAFKTQWMNDAVYQLACFMIMREPEIWRWSHTRHHTDTIIVGRDPEIITPRPPDVVSPLSTSSRSRTRSSSSGSSFCTRAAGSPTRRRPSCLRASARKSIAWLGSISPSMPSSSSPALPPARFCRRCISVCRPCTAAFALYFGATQHLGLAEDVLDHRLNSRTVYMNPIFRFLYWNMNYHVEHHMFPTVPYHALPKLHAAIKADCPTPYPSSIAAYREIIPTVIRQLKDPTYFVRRELPPKAHPEVTASRGSRPNGSVSIEREPGSTPAPPTGFCPRTSRRSSMKASNTRSTAPRTTAISRPTAFAPMRRSNSPTVLFRARSSNARCITAGSTSPPARRRARRPASTLRPIRSGSRTAGCSSSSADRERVLRAPLRREASAR